MTALDVLTVLMAGVAAGAMNAVVGSGSLVSFPALLLVGLPPVAANISNTIGLVLASVGGAWGYRRELSGQARRALVLGALSVAGGLLGGALLLMLPAAVFRAVVPVLIAIALVLVILQPRLALAAARRHTARGLTGPREGGFLSRVGVFGTGVYGGYFGAAQGIILIGLLGVSLDEDLHRINALKNVLVGLVNLTAAVLFAVLWLFGEAPLSWPVAGLLAIGALVGGLLGGRFGRLIPPPVLRGVIVVIGLVAIVALVRG